MTGERDDRECRQAFEYVDVYLTGLEVHTSRYEM
jgi:hypothetical protein